jgi:hypothetical protein
VLRDPSEFGRMLSARTLLFDFEPARDRDRQADSREHLSRLGRALENTIQFDADRWVHPEARALGRCESDPSPQASATTDSCLSLSSTGMQMTRPGDNVIAHCKARSRTATSLIKAGGIR